MKNSWCASQARLVEPTPDWPPSPIWLTRFTAQHYSPKETPGNLRNMVGAPNGARKRKRTREHNTPVVDVDLWLQQTRQANDLHAIQWFTRTFLQQGVAKKQNHKKSRTLNVLHNRWLRICTYMEDLARAHLRTVASTYERKSLGVQSMRHIRGLRSLYDQASRAKQAYHSLVTGHLHEQLLVARMRRRLNSLHQTVETMYHTAKHVATTLYCDSTTVICLTHRYKQHLNKFQELYRTGQCYTQTILNHILDWVYREKLAAQAHQTRRTLYETVTRPMTQQLYLQRKPPREEWDPSAWEVPLQPLPKHHKAHWDPIELEILSTTYH